MTSVITKMSDHQRIFKLIKLEQDNYTVWKWQFKNVACSSGLSALFGGEESKITSEINRSGLSLLGSSLSDDNILKIINCTEFSAAWSTLEQCFENKTIFEPQALFQRLNSYKIGSAADVSKGISEMRGLAAQLKNLNESVSDNMLMGAICQSLPDSLKHFVSIWRNAGDGKLESLIAKLMAEANMLKRDEVEEAVALAARGKVKNDDKGKRGDKGQKKRGSRSRENDECRYCKERGHWVRDCPKRPESNEDYKTGDKKGERSKTIGNKMHSRPEECETLDDFGMTTIQSNLSVSKYKWVADSGCTQHMTPHRELFQDFKPSDTKWMYTADESSRIPVLGEGRINTQFGYLKNVLFVPGLRQNLFSIGSAAKNGIVARVNQDSIDFYKEETMVMGAERENNLYIIDIEPKANMVFANSATLENWHARFGHVSSSYQMDAQAQYRGRLEPRRQS